jgi:exopolysaccharide biosynthesis WecB/TagA/CpsF family protein
MSGPKSMSDSVVVRLDDYDVGSFVQVAGAFGTDRYAFVVTPNVDHVIRYCEDASFRDLYAFADYVLLDSRFLSRLLSITKRLRARVCPGSDLTAELFETVIAPMDEVILIGGSNAQAQQLARQYGLRRLHHYNPPLGFVRDANAVETCLQFIEAHSPFRFCFLAVGCPQQEILANALKARGRARGLALCIGASINFLTGTERRAPVWLQRLGIEWLFRLAQSPGRLAHRYLVRGPKIFLLLPQLQFQLNQPGERFTSSNLVPP